jgi:hypothetical protein
MIHVLFYPRARHSIQLKAPTRDVVGGQTIFRPGISLDFAAFKCEVDDEREPEKWKLVKECSEFKSGVIREGKPGEDPPGRVPRRQYHTGPITSGPPGDQTEPEPPPPGETSQAGDADEKSEAGHEE